MERKSRGCLEGHHVNQLTSGRRDQIERRVCNFRPPNVSNFHPPLTADQSFINTVESSACESNVMLRFI